MVVNIFQWTESNVNTFTLDKTVCSEILVRIFFVIVVIPLADLHSMYAAYLRVAKRYTLEKKCTNYSSITGFNCISRIFKISLDSP